MPVPRSEFDNVVPCEFYTAEELLDADEMYTVYEIARLLQGLEPDADLDPETEAVLIDWAIPWIMENSGDLVIADPRGEDDPGHYGLRRDDDAGGGTDATAADDGDEAGDGHGGADAAGNGDGGDDDGDDADAEGAVGAGGPPPTTGGDAGSADADADTGSADADAGAGAGDRGGESVADE